MDRDDRTAPRRHGGTRIAGVALFALLLLSGPAFGACSDAHGDAVATGPAEPMATMAMGTDPAVVEALWAERPAFVGTSAATEEAYAFALQHPEVVQWMPCYCGCAGMGHDSNLGCYFQDGRVGPAAAFEEHASYCEICIDITLTTKQLYGQGTSLRQIRQIVDQQYGGSGVPGTQTALPPA